MINQSGSQSVVHSFIFSVNQSIININQLNQTINQSVSQSVIRSVGQSVRQSVNPWGNAIEKFLLREFSSNLAQRIIMCCRFEFWHKKWGSPTSSCYYGERNIMPPLVDKNIILRFGIMIFWVFHQRIHLVDYSTLLNFIPEYHGRTSLAHFRFDYARLCIEKLHLNLNCEKTVPAFFLFLI